jgi:hypothetical protein
MHQHRPDDPFVACARARARTDAHASAPPGRVAPPQGRALLLTNTEYLNTKVEKGNVTHGGAAGIIIGVCLLPFMCICLIWAIMYGKRTSGTSEPAYEKAAAAKVEEPAPAPVAAEEAAPAEAASA